MVEEKTGNVALLQSNIAILLRNIGDLGKCRGCDAEIWWVKHKSGKAAPYQSDGAIHFTSCPQANRFRRGKPGTLKS